MDGIVDSIDRDEVSLILLPPAVARREVEVRLRLLAPWVAGGMDELFVCGLEAEKRWEGELILDSSGDNITYEHLLLSELETADEVPWKTVGAERGMCVGLRMAGGTVGAKGGIDTCAGLGLAAVVDMC
jgi:hypothetical protein